MVITDERVTVQKETDETGTYWNIYFSCEMNGRPHNAQLDLLHKPDRNTIKAMLKHWVGSIERSAGKRG